MVMLARPADYRLSSKAEATFPPTVRLYHGNVWRIQWFTRRVCIRYV